MANTFDSHNFKGCSRRRLLGAGVAAAVSFGLTNAAQAQSTWPSKPIRIVAAQAPGSSNDATARALAEYLTGQLKTAVVVENKPGGIGMIAADAVARSAPDGYTLLFTLHSQLAQAPVLLKKPPIDPSKDLMPIGAFSTGLAPMVVKKDLPATNLQELIALAKKRPVSVGNYGIGSSWQIMVTQLAKQTGAQFDLVHYKGTGPMVFDLMAGNIDVGAGSMAGLAAGIQRGAVRPITMIYGDSKNPLLHGIPGWAEQGFVGPAFQDLKEYNMLLAPAGTPADVVQRLAVLVRSSATDSDKVKMVLDQLGVTETPPTGPALKELIAQTWPAYQALTRQLHLAVE